MNRLLQTASAVSAFCVLALAPAAHAEKITQSRDVAAFSEVKSMGSSNVFIEVGKKQSVRVEAEDDEIDEILTEIRGETLIIRRESTGNGIFNSRHTANVYITVPSLEEFVSQGSGDGVVKGLKQDSFKLRQMGSGDITLDGECKSADIASQGSGELTSSTFTCDEVELDQMGSGDVEFDNLETKTITIGSHGSGDMDITGSCKDAAIKNHGSGSSDLRNFKCENVTIASFGSGGVAAFATGDVEVKTMGSGRVNIYGGGRIVELSSSGSGKIKVHKP